MKILLFQVSLLFSTLVFSDTNVSPIRPYVLPYNGQLGVPDSKLYSNVDSPQRSYTSNGYVAPAQVLKKAVHHLPKTKNVTKEYGNPLTENQTLETAQSTYQPYVREPIPIIKIYHHGEGVKDNHVYFETGNGITNSESTITRPLPSWMKNNQTKEDSGESVLIKTGQISWTSPEGQKVYMSYQADDQGYRVMGSHIHTPQNVPTIHGVRIVYSNPNQRSHSKPPVTSFSIYSPDTKSPLPNYGSSSPPDQNSNYVTSAFHEPVTYPTSNPPLVYEIKTEKSQPNKQHAKYPQNPLLLRGYITNSYHNQKLHA